MIQPFGGNQETVRDQRLARGASAQAPNGDGNFMMTGPAEEIGEFLRAFWIDNASGNAVKYTSPVAAIGGVGGYGGLSLEGRRGTRA